MFTMEFPCSELLVLSIASLFTFGSCQKVLLNDVKVLTLHDGQYTTGRRNSPVKQLNCVGGAAAKYKPSTVQCYNKGFDGRDVQWKCEADLDDKAKFGTIEVTCEGYDYPDDPYILVGSCGLDYSLELTEKGRQEGNGGGYWGSGNTNYNSPNYYKSQSWGIADILVWCVVIAIVYVIYKTCTAPSRTDADGTGGGAYPGGGGGGGGGGWGGGGGNPPPPGFRDAPPPAYDDCTSSRHTGAGAGTGIPGGFWSGLGAGGILGYMFGNRGNRGYGYNSGPYDGAQYGFGGRPRSSWGMGGSSYGGGGGGSSWGSSSGASTSGTHTSSGYGGTRRR